jgi:hypothetical protein
MASVAGPIIAGVASTLLSKLWDSLSGANDKHLQIPRQTPEQQQLLSQVLQNAQQMGGPGQGYQSAQNFLSNLLAPNAGGFNQFAQPYMQQFEQQFLPRIAEQYAGAGGGLGGGIGSSSGFGQGIAGAASNLQSQLAQMFSNLQRGAASDISNQYNNIGRLGLGIPSFETAYQPGNTGLVGGAASGAASSIGKYGGKELMEMLFNQAQNSNGTGIDTTGGQLGVGGGGIYPTQGNYNPYEG